jgi:hypothetical protein
VDFHDLAIVIGISPTNHDNIAKVPFHSIYETGDAD